jgi:hypothetical protein
VTLRLRADGAELEAMGLAGCSRPRDAAGRGAGGAGVERDPRRPDELDRQASAWAADRRAARADRGRRRRRDFNPDSPKQLATCCSTRRTTRSPGWAQAASQDGLLDRRGGAGEARGRPGDRDADPGWCSSTASSPSSSGRTSALKEEITPRPGACTRASTRRSRRRAALVERPEPAEHPDPHGHRSRDPQGVRRARGARARQRGLLADRAAPAGAPVEGPGADRGVRAGEDIHTAVAAQIHGVPIGEVTREQRNGAKMVNFGIVYGITPFGLARRLGRVQRPRRPRSSTTTSARFPGITTFLAECVASGAVAQLVRVPDCRSGGCGFESRPPRGHRGSSRPQEVALDVSRLRAFVGVVHRPRLIHASRAASRSSLKHRGDVLRGGAL